jgi:hypothetical protein
VHDTQHKAESELPALVTDVSRGRWVDAVARGNRLLAMGDLTKQQVATIERALLEAYVALDAPGLAAGACAAWKAADPSARLDPGPPDLVSPKVRAACK